MIKKFVFVVFCCFIFNLPAFACDACGSGAGGMGNGLYTDFKSNYIRIAYFNIGFGSNGDHTLKTMDSFRQYDLSVRYVLGKSKRYILKANLPYGKNTRSNDGQNQTTNGIADLRLSLSYVLLSNKKLCEKAKIYLEAGGGLSLPTGKYNTQIHDSNLPENFNIGQGSIGYTLQLNSVISSEKYGLALNNNIQLNGNTSSGYHYGNQFNTQAIIFRDLSLNKFTITPNIGLAYEYLSKDQFKNKNSVLETGGNGSFLSSAVNIRTKKWQSGISYATPLAGNYSEGEAIAKARLSVQFSFIF